VKQLLAQARKRVISHLVLDKGALALAIGMGGVVLLLLAGTQILDWYWPVLLAAVSLGVGVYQLRKFIPSVYVLAQRIDRKMALADSLSTAVYFSEHPKPGLESVCAVQFQEADRLAAGVNLEQALPLARSRYLLPALVLLAVASGLFVTRYVMTGSMDLQASLIDMVVDNFFTSPAEVASAKAARPDLKLRPFDPSQPNLPPSEEEIQPQLPPDAEKGADLKSDPAADSKGGDGEKGPGDAEDKGAEQEEGDSGKDGSPKDKQSDKQDSGGDDKGQSDSQGQDQRSMLDKLRDAVNNLMNKMSSDPPQKGAPKSGEKQQSKAKEKGDKSQEKGEKAEGDPQSESDEQGDQGDPKDAKQSNAPGQKPSEDAKSGAGQDDGKKDIEKVKALEAMGKMSELLGERSAAISGEVMVEVGTTKQQLKTAMTQQKAGHTDAGGEIHRDQVPLAYQTFVERYFQEVRKTSGAAKAAPKGAEKSK
jgi:hypothetical protein